MWRSTLGTKSAERVRGSGIALHIHDNFAKGSHFEGEPYQSLQRVRALTELRIGFEVSCGSWPKAGEGFALLAKFCKRVASFRMTPPSITEGVTLLGIRLRGFALLSEMAKGVKFCVNPG